MISLLRISLILASIFAAEAVQAKSFLINSPPTYEPNAGEFSLFMGGIADDGSTLKPTDLTLEIDGKIEKKLAVSNNLLDFSQTNSEANPTWKTPIAIGLVYLWVKETPSTFSDSILQGVDNFFKRVPPRSSAYATLYGRKRQPVPKLRASEIAGNLYDIGFLDGTKPNLAEAIKINLRALQSDDSPLKVLLLITDGRDFTDPYGESSADFTSISTEISKAGIKLFLLTVPPPENDPEQTTKNIADLGLQSTFSRTIEQPVELQSTLAALGQSIADLSRVVIPVPWSWKTFGGTRKVRINCKFYNKARPVEIGKLTIVPSGNWKIWLLIVPVVLIGGVSIAFLLKRGLGKKSQNADPQLHALLRFLHSLMQKGLPARRILVELTKKHAHEVSLLTLTDFATLPSNHFPIFRTHSGKRRLQEVLSLLNAKDVDGSRLDQEFAAFLSTSITKSTPPSQVASTMQVKFTEDQIGYFSRLNLNDLALELKKWAKEFPVLSSPKTRGITLEIQGILHNLRKGSPPINVAWLVRAAGPGSYGETLRLPSHSVRIGNAPGSAIRVSSDGFPNECYAELIVLEGAFYILPGQGTVTIEGRPITQKQQLRDGYTLSIGASQFIFKQVYTDFTDDYSRQA